MSSTECCKVAQATAKDIAVDGTALEFHLGKFGGSIHATQGRATIDGTINGRRIACTSDGDEDVARSGGARIVVARVGTTKTATKDFNGVGARCA